MFSSLRRGAHDGTEKKRSLTCFSRLLVASFATSRGCRTVRMLKAVAVMRQEIEKQQVRVPLIITSGSLSVPTCAFEVESSPSRRHGATGSHFRKGSPRRQGAATSANWRSGSPRSHARSPSKRAGYGGQFGAGGGYATGYSPAPSKTLQGPSQCSRGYCTV